QRRRIVEAAVADLSRHPVVIELADAGHVVAGLLEELRQRYHVGDVLAKLGRVLQHAGLIRPQTRQERRTARIAEWILAVRSVEPHAAAGQLVDPRRLDDLMSVAGKRVV